uniref:hypothetical protein n=1 Tax=Bacillus altitudinis TaxID=293387 RepID=UPI001C92DFF0
VRGVDKWDEWEKVEGFDGMCGLLMLKRCWLNWMEKVEGNGMGMKGCKGKRDLENLVIGLGDGNNKL